METVFTGVDREPGEYPRGVVLSFGAVSNSRRHASRDCATARHRRQRRVQEPGLALRADAPRPGGLRRLRGLPAPRHTPPADARTLLGGLHRRLSQAFRYLL